MKATKIERPNHTGLIVVAATIILVALGTGAVLGYEKLKSIYLEQCVITDMATQVEISAGKMVHPSTIAEELGLRVGANLALIDFSAKREELLAKVPNLREVRISRRLPDKVVISTDERTPVARMGLKGKNNVTGRVVDTEGMVFSWQRGTQTLPLIREAQAPGTARGRHAKGRTMAALRLVEACLSPELVELGVLEVDTSKHDFLVATLGNYSKLKILWDGMDEPQTPASKADLLQRLTRLRDAIRSRVASNAVIWNATVPARIFADTQEKL